MTLPTSPSLGICLVGSATYVSRARRQAGVIHLLSKLGSACVPKIGPTFFYVRLVGGTTDALALGQRDYVHLAETFIANSIRWRAIA